MCREDPVKAQQARQQHVYTSGHSNFDGLLAVVRQYTRSKTAQMTEKRKEVSKRKFYAKHRNLGYKKTKIDKKWLKATSAEAYKLGLARKCGKKELVFMEKAREFSSSDVMSMTLAGASETNYISQTQAKQMLHGRNAIELSDRAKKDAFGGYDIIIIVTIRHHHHIFEDIHQ